MKISRVLIISISLLADLDMTSLSLAKAKKDASKLNSVVYFSAHKVYPCLITRNYSTEKGITLIVIQSAVVTTPPDPYPHLILKKEVQYPWI